MSAPTAADLRAAALSDLRHPSGTGMLHVLLPDVLGEPFGGTATPEQLQATAEATGRYVPAQLFPGKDTRPHDLRALLRSWAASQDQPRWEIRPYNTPHEHVWVILRDSKAVAEVYDRQDAEFVLAALQARPDAQPVRPGTDNATGLRTAIQILQGLDAQGNPATLP